MSINPSRPDFTQDVLDVVNAIVKRSDAHRDAAARLHRQVEWIKSQQGWEDHTEASLLVTKLESEAELEAHKGQEAEDLADDLARFFSLSLG